MSVLDLAASLIRRHEGWRSRPYRDTEGLLTIGYGFCLDRIEMPRSVGEVWLRHLIEDIDAALRMHFDWYEGIDGVRQAVLIDMAYNLGVPGLLRFRRMLAALERGDFETAADEMLDSKWAKQVGRRADELARIMRSGDVGGAG